MVRNIYQKLLKWKNDIYRKPLVLKGARQVGKTYIITEFAKNEFDNYVILNCDKDKRIKNIFENGYRTERIISDIELLSGEKVIAGKTLIFIDEVADVPEAIASLKYFCEDAPEYHIIVAGSLLGLAIRKGVSFPVGKVDEMTLYPMSFEEFIRAHMGEASYERLKAGPIDEFSSVKELYTEELRMYYFLGGMPEVVQGYLIREHLRNSMCLNSLNV